MKANVYFFLKDRNKSIKEEDIKKLSEELNLSSQFQLGDSFVEEVGQDEFVIKVETTFEALYSKMEVLREMLKNFPGLKEFQLGRVITFRDL